MALYPRASGGYVRYGTDGFPRLAEPDESLIEDFEHQSLEVYGDDTDAFRIQGTNVIEGRYSLESTVAQRTIGASSDTRPTPRGTADDPIEYTARLVLEDDGQASLMTNAQSPSSPWSNCYVLLVDTGNDRIRLLRRENGGTDNHETKPAGQSLSPGTEYRPGITLSDEGIQGALYDSTGDLIVQTDAYPDAVFTGGGLGWHNGIGTTTYFDYANSNPNSIDDLTKPIVEDFESGDLSGYWIRDTSGSANVTPTAAFHDSYGLEMDGFSEIQTTPGSGRPGYIRDGIPIRFRVNFRVLGSQQYWVPFCPSVRDSRGNRYTLQFIMDGGFRIRKADSSGSQSTVPGTSSEGRDYAACYNLSYSSETWYYAILEADQSDGLYAALYTAGGTRVAWISSSESEYVDAENGYGFYCSGSGRVFYDYLHETER